MAYELNAPLGRMKLGRYADGEISVQVLDNVRGKDVVRAAATRSQPLQEILFF